MAFLSNPVYGVGWSCLDAGLLGGYLVLSVPIDFFYVVIRGALKEISYIHSEAYAAGELKHGPISLIEDGTIVISVITQDNLVEKTISNMVEVKSRGARLMAVTMAGNYFIEDTAEFTAYVPRINKLFAGSLAVVPLQLVGYYVTIAKGFDVDKPRNLAKSVTVE